jgi:hypothetical protein
MNTVAISFVLRIQFLLVGICWCGSCEEEKCAMIDHILERNTVNAKRSPPPPLSLSPLEDATLACLWHMMMVWKL